MDQIFCKSGAIDGDQRVDVDQDDWCQWLAYCMIMRYDVVLHGDDTVNSRYSVAHGNIQSYMFVSIDGHNFWVNVEYSVAITFI